MNANGTKQIELKAFAKVNLSIDVLGVREDGYHRVDMILQSVSLYDTVTLVLSAGSGKIRLKTGDVQLPRGKDNLACQAALLFKNDLETYNLSIIIEKNIPIAAGLAGGSADAAAVLHGLNALLRLGLSVKELARRGKRLGADVPFCVLSQAKHNDTLPASIRLAGDAGSCARARGIGERLTPLTAHRFHLVIAKPDLAVSTEEVYRGIDDCDIKERPATEKIIEDLRMCRYNTANVAAWKNVLEAYTLHAYPQVRELKERMRAGKPVPENVLMSGSGPAVYAVMDSMKEAREKADALSAAGYETYVCTTNL